MFDPTQPIYSRPDGSFVITYRGMPYHLTLEDEYKPEGLWETVMGHIESNPDSVQPEPQPEPPTEDELREQRIAEIKWELVQIDQHLIRPMAEIAAGTADDEDRERFDELMERKEKLREELKELEKSE